MVSVIDAKMEGETNVNADYYEFQILNWYTADIEVDNDDSDEEEDEDGKNIGDSPPLKYVMKLFGVDSNGGTIGVSVMDFTPHFYVKLSKQWSSFDMEKFRIALKSNMGYAGKGKIELQCMKKRDFWGFSNNQKFYFLRLCFESHKVAKIAARTITSPKFSVPGVYQRKYKLYESNIEPFLRFAHIQNIQPAGWVRIPKNKTESKTEVLPSKCDVDIQTNWKNVESIVKEEIAPLLVASFDLECMSCDGDFPVPVKTYQKIATNMFNIYNDNKGKPHDNYEVKQRLLKYLQSIYEEGQVIAKKSELGKWSLETVWTRYQDHIVSIIKGDTGIIEKGFSEIVGECFTKNTDVAEQVGRFYRKLKKEGATAVHIRKSIGTCLTNQFEKNKEITVNGLSIEDVIETLVKVLFGDKDGIITILTRLLDNIMCPLEGDEIIQIGTTFHRYGQSQCHKKVIFSLGTCDQLGDGIDVREFDKEEDMIMAWCDLINETNPDIITGYNIFGFDFNYIYHRALELGCEREFCKIGRLVGHTSAFKTAKLSSSALGDNLMKYVEMEGRTLIDLMKVVQRDHRLDSYKLDNVANHFMKMNKNDVSPQDIFRLYKGTSADRAVVGDYCLQDCALCNHLMMKLEIVANNMGMANVCSVPLSWIFMRGQGVKIFSLVAKECKSQGFLIPVVSKYNNRNDEDKKKDDEEGGYEGAIVLEPKTGIYTDKPVTIFDYASLYPSSMISENISHDSIVLDDKYDNLPGVEYLNITYDLFEKIGDEKKKIGEQVCRYVQPQDGEKGIIPNILMHLLKQRKLTRKKIGLQRVTLVDARQIEGFYSKGSGKVLRLDGTFVEFDEETEFVKTEDVYNNFQKAVLDGLQLAYKVTANSLYGQVGATTSPIYMKYLAASTTATGRKMIMLAKDFMEKEYNAEIIYGDSVTGDTPMLIRFPDGTVDIRTIETLCDEWKPYEQFMKKGNHKEQGFIHAQVWANGNWADIKRVIRHETNKKIYRVNTFSGCVDVTEDHSLIGLDGSKISPCDMKVGETELKHSFPQEFITDNATNRGKYICNAFEAWIWGAFFSSGSCEERSENKYAWEIVSHDLQLIEKAKRYIEIIENQSIVQFKVLNDSSRVYKLIAEGSSNDIVEKYRKHFYEKDNSKKIPAIIFNAPFDVRLSFFNGYYGEVMSKFGWNLQCSNKIGTQGLYYLMRSIGLKDMTVSNQDCNDNVYQINSIADKRVCDKYKNRVLQIKELDTTDDLKLVYDIETEDGMFHGGVGELICQNTDSLFLNFPMPETETSVVSRDDSLKYSYEMAQKAAEHIKPLLKAPHDLEYEKIFYPMILFSKKRYCANKYEHDLEKFKQVSMGIALKRRDNANIVKKIYGGIIDIILNDHDVAASVKFLRDSLHEMVNGKYPLEDFIITKTLKGHYKDPSRISHKVLAERIKERSPGNAPQVNDRIPFAYVEVKDDKCLQGERIEHPDYIREKKLKVDYLFYLTNQVQNPVLQLYALILEQLEGYRLPKNHWHDLKAKMAKEGKSKKYICDKIAELRESEARKLLFGDTLNSLKLKKAGQTQLTDFFGNATK